MKNIRKILALILSGIMVFSCMSFTAFATDRVPMEKVENAESTTKSIVSIRGSFSGYASKFVSSSGQGSFTVSTSGLPLLSAGLTLKTSCDESNESLAVVTIKRPDNSYVVQNLVLSGNQERVLTFYFPSSGTYTFNYTIYVPSGATVHMQAWIYG